MTKNENTAKLKSVDEKEIPEKDDEKRPISTKELKAMIEAEEQERVQACSDGLTALLQHHNCFLDYSFTIGSGAIQRRLEVKAHPLDKPGVTVV